MTDETKFTIIIPTRERSKVLPWAIKTCLIQDYNNFEIIVSDNNSQDDTHNVVISLNDKRIKYINPKKRLGMSQHWEFALSHVTEGFVTILGDDDGLMPSALKEVNELIKKTNCQAIKCDCIDYNWPDHISKFRKNLISFSKIEDKFEVLQTKNELNDVLEDKQSYANLPGIYKGFLDINLLNKLKGSKNRVFNSITPDVYLALAIPSQLEDYCFSHKPFAINGASAFSNGVSSSAKNKKDRQAINMFLQEDNIPFHSKLEFISHSVPLIIVECLLQAIDNGLYNASNFDINKILLAALERTIPQNQKEIELFYAIARKNGISKEVINEILQKQSLEQKLNNSNRMFKFKNRYLSNIQDNTIDGNNLYIKNVYDAALLLQPIIDKKELKKVSINTPFKKMIRDIKQLF